MESNGITTLAIGIIVIGAGISIAFIGYSAMHNIARQPAKSTEMRMIMIIAAALIEGITLFALVICLLVVLGIKAI